MKPIEEMTLAEIEAEIRGRGLVLATGSPNFKDYGYGLLKPTADSSKHFMIASEYPMKSSEDIYSSDLDAARAALRWLREEKGEG